MGVDQWFLYPGSYLLPCIFCPFGFRAGPDWAPCWSTNSSGIQPISKRWLISNRLSLEIQRAISKLQTIIEMV